MEITTLDVNESKEMPLYCSVVCPWANNPNIGMCLVLCKQYNNENNKQKQNNNEK